MTVLTFLSNRIETALDKAKFSKDRTDIPNSHAVVTPDVERLTRIASALGVDFANTEYTFTVVNKDDGKAIYAVSLMAQEGLPVICWGKVRFPLANVKTGTDISLEVEDKKIFLEVSGEDSEGDYNFTIPVILSKKLTAKPDRAELRKAMKAGTLGQYLAVTFVKAKSLAEVPAGTYSVIGYNIRYWKGEAKVEVIVKGVGTVNANTTLKKKILGAMPLITPESPAEMVVGISTRTTDKGFSIIPVTLETQEDKDIPVFDFSFEEGALIDPTEQKELDAVLQF